MSNLINRRIWLRTGWAGPNHRIRPVCEIVTVAHVAVVAFSGDDNHFDSTECQILVEHDDGRLSLHTVRDLYTRDPNAKPALVKVDAKAKKGKRK